MAAEVKYSCLECPICNIPYSETIAEHVPVVLHCGHHVCRGCARRLWQNYSITCPYDRKYMIVYNPNDLPRCFTIQELMREVAEENGGAPAPAPIPHRVSQEQVIDVVNLDVPVAAPAAPMNPVAMNPAPMHPAPMNRAPIVPAPIPAIPAQDYEALYILGLLAQVQPIPAPVRHRDPFDHFNAAPAPVIGMANQQQRNGDEALRLINQILAFRHPNNAPNGQ